ncbi:MAG: OmpA family protein, partial [Bacteroidota bacterium]
YYASVREDGQGFTDIYQVSILQDDEVGETLASKGYEEENTENEIPDTADPEKVEVDATNDLQPVTLTVTVVDNNGESTDAKISLSNKADGRMAGKSTRGKGIYSFTVTLPESTEYNLSVEKPGYVFQNMDILIPAAISSGQDISKKVTLRPLQVGTRKILRNIYFDFDKASFKDESYTELNKLEAMVAQNSGMTIEISGHTDNIGNNTYNKDLSQRRANAVKNYLVDKGIDARRIMSIGYGEERPLASNDDEREGRELNRRVEFKVIGK